MGRNGLPERDLNRYGVNGRLGAQKLGSEGRIKSLCRGAVIVWAATMAGTSLAGTPPAPTDRNISQHENWIRGCTDSRITVVRQELVVLYAIDLGRDGDEVIQCLLPGRNPGPASQVSNSEAAFLFPSPVDFDRFEDGLPKRTEAMIQTDTGALIISGPDSASGIEKIELVSGTTFVVQTSHVTHTRAYLVFSDRAELAYLTNGVVEILDREALTFRVHGRKSYFGESGAFWFDAVLDQDGNILDVVTPLGHCMSRQELARQSSLDLSRVDRSEVCIDR